jgi:hypothetical protein
MHHRERQQDDPPLVMKLAQGVGKSWGDEVPNSQTLIKEDGRSKWTTSEGWRSS